MDIGEVCGDGGGTMTPAVRMMDCAGVRNGCDELFLAFEVDDGLAGYCRKRVWNEAPM